jgi:site-specific recombinase XerC
MDDIRQTAIDRFRLYLERRQFSAHTIANYTLDLRLFFTEVAVPLAQVSFREVDQFVEHQHRRGRIRKINGLLVLPWPHLVSVLGAGKAA